MSSAGFAAFRVTPKKALSNAPRRAAETAIARRLTSEGSLGLSPRSTVDRMPARGSRVRKNESYRCQKR